MSELESVANTASTDSATTIAEPEKKEGNIRIARCCCGQFQLELNGDPIRTSICHCFACQQRTGSCFGMQGRYNDEQILGIKGEYTIYKRIGDGGCEVTYKFCPTCGSTLCWQISGWDNMTAVAVGGLSDPHIMAPTFSVYEARKHDWVQVPQDITHWD